MINVSDETKIEWATDSSQKEYEITVGNVVVSNGDIVQGTLSYAEKIIDSNSLEFVGCIAKKFEFTTSAFNGTNLKGKTVSLRVRAGATDWIQLFTGKIDESRKESMKGLKRVVAYDLFYSLSQKDACDWWNGLGLTTLFGSFISFITEFGVTPIQTSIRFVNADIYCYGGSKRQAKKLTALDYLKQLCQINGGIGYTDGQGRFGIKYINTVAETKFYPANTLFPSNFIYPSNTDQGETGATTIPYYKELDYEDYSINQIDKVTIRNTSEEVGVYYPYAGSNNYIIQGNIFAFDQTSTVLLTMAHNIYFMVKDAIFRPFNCVQMAFPWLECGDLISYYDVDDNGNTTTATFAIMSRTMSGGAMLWDNFEAEGEQDQRIFITDLKAQLEDLQNQIVDNEEETPNGSLYGMVAVEYTTPIEASVMGAYEASISGIATEV